MAAASGIRAGRAYVEIGANDTGLRKALDASEAKLKAWGASVASIGAQVGGLGAAVAGSMFAAAKTFADAGSTLNDMSARTGMSVETLSALGHAATMTGAELGDVEAASRKLAKNLATAAGGSAEARASFRQLGLSVQALARMSPDQQFEAVARAIARVPNPTAKAAAAMELMGKSATKILPMIDDMDALTKEAKDLGLVMSTENAQAADALGDALDNVSSATGSVVKAVGSALAPLLTEVAKAITANVVTVARWVRENRGLVETVFKVGAGLTLVGGGLVALGAALAGTGVALGSITTTFGAILSPAAAVTAALGIGVAAINKYTNAGSIAVAWLKTKFGELATSVKGSLSGMADALAAGDLALAGKILWASLNVEWLKGIARLDEAWGGWIAGYKESIIGAQDFIARVMIGGQAEIKSAWTKFFSWFHDALDGITVLLTKWHNVLGGIIAKIMTGLVGPESGQALQDIFSEIDKDIAARNAAAEQAAGDRINNRGNERGKNLAGIDAERNQQIQILAEQQALARDARASAANEAIKAAAAELKDAQDKLEKLRKDAAKGAEKGAAEKAKPPDAPGGPLSPENLDQTIERTAAKVDVAGSFNAASLAGMGAGSSVADRITDLHKEAQKQTKELEKLNKKDDPLKVN